MAAIAPNTDLKILYDVPLDASQEHTIYFGNPTDQHDYFASKVLYTFSQLTYQRVNSGHIRVEKSADDLYNCNYLMFRNTSFGTKWFYAFITKVEYINNNTSEITYMIDDMQTWLFEWEFRSCFIERQHSISDNWCEHYEPEPVAVGEYVFNDYQMLDQALTELGVIVAVIALETGGDPRGKLYEGIYSGAALVFFRDDALGTGTIAASINGYLRNFVATPDNIVAMYMCPYKFVGQHQTIAPGNFNELNKTSECYNDDYTLPGVTAGTTIDGYTPRNKKLYTYPYNFLHVDNGASGELSLRYEFFEDFTPTLEINGSILEPVQAVLYPRYYKGVTGTYGGNNAKVYNPESLPLTDYPYCSWNFDSYKQWKNTEGIAKAIRYYGKQANAIINAGTTFIGGAMSGRDGAAESALLSGGGNMAGNLVSYITDYMSGSYLASMQADICKGSNSNGQVNCTRKRQTYYYGRCSINRQSAQMIDTFFDKFGYALNKVDTPSIHARRLWTYLKTKDCTIVGSVPAVAMKNICSIFNRGITFWTNGDQIGRYDLAAQNTPL